MVPSSVAHNSVHIESLCVFQAVLGAYSLVDATFARTLNDMEHVKSTSFIVSVVFLSLFGCFDEFSRVDHENWPNQNEVRPSKTMQALSAP
jgi:hypothetical protein